MGKHASCGNGHHSRSTLKADAAGYGSDVAHSLCRNAYAETIAPPLATAVKYGVIKPMTADELLAASAF